MSSAPKKPTKPRCSKSGTVRTGAKHWSVVKGRTGWVVREAGSARAGAVYATRAEAQKAARETVRITGGEVRVQAADGRWRESFTIGRSNFAKISAVEGIVLSREMRRDFRVFDRKGLSDDERHGAIVRKYGKKPA
jgi:hypothetical protein